MKIRHRLHFQLTPLLDLLLIVIFAQYMEVRQTAETGREVLEQKKTDLETAYQARQSALEKQHAARETDSLVRLAEARRTLDATGERYREYYESLQQQQQQAGTALANALNLPQLLTEQILRLKENRRPDAKRLQTAVQHMQELLQSRGAEMVRFILRYDEMQKHVSVWELYLQDNGQATFSDGEQQKLVSFGTREEFVSRAFEASKAFTEPKPLVIILLSYGDAQAGQRRRATDGMSLLVEQLRRDAGNTRWFDFSLLGFRPSGPLFDRTQTPAGAESDDRTPDL